MERNIELWVKQLKTEPHAYSIEVSIHDPDEEMRKRKQEGLNEHYRDFLFSLELHSSKDQLAKLAISPWLRPGTNRSRLSSVACLSLDETKCPSCGLIPLLDFIIVEYMGSKGYLRDVFSETYDRLEDMLDSSAYMSDFYHSLDQWNTPENGALSFIDSVTVDEKEANYFMKQILKYFIRSLNFSALEESEAIEVSNIIKSLWSDISNHIIKIFLGKWMNGRICGTS